MNRLSGIAAYDPDQPRNSLAAYATVPAELAVGLAGLLGSQQTQIWGGGGIVGGYNFRIFKDLSSLRREPGGYIMVYRRQSGICIAQYVGETEDFFQRHVENAHEKHLAALQEGIRFNELHVLAPIHSKGDRLAIESGLISSITPRPPLYLERSRSGVGAALTNKLTGRDY